jgi:hypothetical protein
VPVAALIASGTEKTDAFPGLQGAFLAGAFNCNNEDLRTKVLAALDIDDFATAPLHVTERSGKRFP